LHQTGKKWAYRPAYLIGHVAHAVNRACSFSGTCSMAKASKSGTAMFTSDFLSFVDS
jgi:hypothetical protein